MKAPTATLLLLLSSSTSLTSAHQHPQQPHKITRIVGGNESTPDAYSFMAGFWVQEDPNVPSFQITCGGSLVAPQIVLTAAHCKLPNDEDVNYYVYLGDHDVSSLTNDDEERFLVEEVVVHPEYNETYEYENDVMLLRLKEDTSAFQPLELASSFPSDGVVTVAGWGVLEFEGNTTDVLMEVDVSILPVEECDSYLVNVSMPPYPDGDGFLCAQGYGTDACAGDSGGPLFYSDSGVFKQVGVVSWGVGCADADHPGIYADVPYYMDWLRENIADMSSTGPSPSLPPTLHESSAPTLSSSPASSSLPQSSSSMSNTISFFIYMMLLWMF